VRIYYFSIVDSQQKTKDVTGDRLRIGRGRQNDLVLNSPFVAEEAALLQKNNGAWELIALGLNAVYLGDEPLYRGQRRAMAAGKPIRLPPFTLELELPSQAAGADRHLQVLDDETLRLIQEVHVELLKRMRGELQGGTQTPEEIPSSDLKRWEDEIERIADERGLTDPAHAAWVDHLAGYAILAAMLKQLSAAVSKEEDAARFEALAGRSKSWSRQITANRDREAELDNTCRYVARSMGLEQEADPAGRLLRLERDFPGQWDKIRTGYHADFKLYLARCYLKKQVKDLVFGYGPLEDLLLLPTISEIMVVDSQHIYVEKRGRIENSGRRFLSDDVTVSIIERIVSQVGRTIDKSRPLVDARLADGSRVNAVIPPLAYSGPCLTIRKFPARKLVVDDLVRLGAISQAAAEFLRASVLNRRNILISGGTGTGKTTLLNCLSDFIPDQERIVTVEDTVELQLSKEHVVQLETKAANVEGQGAYTIRDLVRNALRMRPDRIVVGECRGAEALDMLQAMNTGHDGSLTTIHANSAGDVVLRLEVMVQMAADLPLTSIHRQIASAIDLIVQLQRLRDGRRVVVQVAEVAGLHPQTGRAEIRDLFALDDAEGEKPQLIPTGHLPSFMHELVVRGMINEETFYR
jgi:Flp pilus assembly CpaF family ATPase